MSTSRTSRTAAAAVLALVALTGCAGATATPAAAPAPAVPALEAAPVLPAGSGGPGTVGVLRELRGVMHVDELPSGGVDEQSAASDLVVLGPVVGVVDDGPADPGGSVTHVFRLRVQVQERIKGTAPGTIEVTTLGSGDAEAFEARLGRDAGLWLLQQVEGRLVPFRSDAVLFDVDGAAVAPFAHAGHAPAVRTLQEAVEKARRGAGRPQR